MSAAVVRKALEVSEDAPGPLEKAAKSVGKKKSKALQKKKKATPDQLLKKNLKILKALEFASRAKKYGANPTVISFGSKKSKKKQKEETSVFTEEDFAKFEKEYFVTDCN